MGSVKDKIISFCKANTTENIVNQHMYMSAVCMDVKINQENKKTKKTIRRQNN